MFVIDDVVIFCGCILVEYLKELVLLGKFLDIIVIYKVDYLEYFNKIIMVYCNFFVFLL